MEHYREFGDTFAEKGFNFEALVPTDEEVPRAFVVLVTKDEEKYDGFIVPMMYEPRWAIDVEDIGALEGVTDDYIRGLDG